MAKRRKRKIKIFRLLLLLFIVIALIIASIFLVKLITMPKKQEAFKINEETLNELDYSESTTLDLDLYSNAYELIRLNDFKVLFAKNNDAIIYPASLTKVLTMNAALSVVDDINDVSSFTNEQREYLIENDASLSYIDAHKNYSISDLLYALVLPSGADAAASLDNYVINKTGNDLVTIMNNRVEALGLKNSHFTNTTGLHDDNLYTTIDDYAKIVINTLLNDNSKKVLKTKETYVDGLHFYSTLKELFEKCEDLDNVHIFGGKTGFTLEAGMNLMVLFEANNRSYMLILADAPGNPYRFAAHIEDAYKIINHLYYN